MDRITAYEPSETTDEGMIIGERPAPYIPNAVFDAFNEASNGSLTEKEPSSPSMNEKRRVVIEALQKRLGITHWLRVDKVHIDILEAAEALFVRNEQIANEDLLHKVLLLILCNLDPKNYSPGDALVMKRKSDSLQRALIAEFKKRRKFDLADNLEQQRVNSSGQHKAVKT